MNMLELKNKPYVLKTNKYSTIDFILSFPYHYDINNIFAIKILKGIMMSSSKKYPDETKFNDYLQKHMLLYDIDTYRWNECYLLEFKLSIPDPKKVDGIDIEKEIKFFLDTIYKPNIKNKLFSKRDFDREKKYLKDSIKRYKKDIYTYSDNDFNNYFDQENIINDTTINNEKKLSSIKNSDIYNLYQNIITKNRPIVFAYGNISKKEVRNLFSKILNNNEKIKVNSNYERYLNLKSKTLNIEKKSNFNQSVLTMGYKVKGMCKKDENYLYLLNNILMSKENRLLLKALRIDNELVYDCYSYSANKNGILVICAFLNKDSKEKAIEVVNKLILKLKNNKSFVNDEVKKYTKGAYYTLLRTLDNKYSKFDYYIDRILKYDNFPKEKYNNLKHADLNYFHNFLNRLKLDTVYFLRGDSDEK